MNFSGKCQVLGDFWLLFKNTENEGWQEFIHWADLGLPLAYSASVGYITIKRDSQYLVNEVWDVFCKMIEIDPDGKYEDIEAAFNASPRPVLE